MSVFNSDDLSAVQEMLHTCEHKDDIIAAIHIIAHANAIHLVSDMMPYLFDKRPAVRNAVMASLLRLGQDAIPEIVNYRLKIDPDHNVHLAKLVATFWNNERANPDQYMMQHEQNRMLWSIIWALAKPLSLADDIGYIFDDIADDPLTAIRWAATQSLMSLAHSSDHLPENLADIALPLMIDNYKYGDVNLGETSVGTIALLTSPEHPAIPKMLTSSSQDLQVVGVKVLAEWVHGGQQLNAELLQALKSAMPTAGWQMTNEISRLRYALSAVHPEALQMLEDAYGDDSTIGTILYPLVDHTRTA